MKLNNSEKKEKISIMIDRLMDETAVKAGFGLLLKNHQVKKILACNQHIKKERNMFIVDERFFY